MRLLGIIKRIEGKPRTWTNANGETVYSFKMAFEAEGNQFLGKYTIAPQRLAQLGIRPGAVGHMDVRFSIRDFVSKQTGETVYIQEVRFSKWSLANQNAPEAPATEAAPAAPETQAPAAPTAEQVKAEAEAAVEQAQVDGTGLPF